MQRNAETDANTYFKTCDNIRLLLDDIYKMKLEHKNDVGLGAFVCIIFNLFFDYRNPLFH